MAQKNTNSCGRTGGVTIGRARTRRLRAASKAALWSSFNTNCERNLCVVPELNSIHKMYSDACSRTVVVDGQRGHGGEIEPYPTTLYIHFHLETPISILKQPLGSRQHRQPHTGETLVSNRLAKQTKIVSRQRLLPQSRIFTSSALERFVSVGNGVLWLWRSEKDSPRASAIIIISRRWVNSNNDGMAFSYASSPRGKQNGDNLAADPSLLFQLLS